ncbi:MAG: FecCD family ABC transporter permease, partial [Gemmatimonadales bacterium]
MKSGHVVLLVLAIAGIMVASIMVGAVALSPGAVLHGLIDPDAPAGVIVRRLRVPRVLLGFLVGGSLGISGAALQALIRNPLADPFLLGLSGGAGLGAVIAIAFGIGGAWAIPLMAFGGALLAIGLVYRLGVVSGGRLDPRILLLAGVVTGAFASSLMSAIIVLSDADRLRNAFLWLLGGLGAASWQSVTIFAVYAIFPVGIILYHARALDLLVLGEDTARHLGADTERTKRVIYTATALLTAAGVAVCGIIGFIGLVVPHAVRQLGGPLHRGLLPLSFIGGGTFLVLADALARTVVRPVELPVGIVTA